MGFRVERTEYDPQDGFLYYVAFKPTLELEKDEIHARVPVEAAISLTETGDIADLSFEVPKGCRSDHALTFCKNPQEASYVEPRLFVAMAGRNGDTVISAGAKLDLDLAGRVVGMEIQWIPSDQSAASTSKRGQASSATSDAAQGNEGQVRLDLSSPSRRCQS